MVLYRKRGLLGKNSDASRARVIAAQAFTIVELIVATTVIGLVAGSSIYALLDANRYAATQRVRTAAKAACQERIDQALTTPYSPPDALPALFTRGGSIPAPNGSPDRVPHSLCRSKRCEREHRAGNKVDTSLALGCNVEPGPRLGSRRLHLSRENICLRNVRSPRGGLNS